MKMDIKLYFLSSRCLAGTSLDCYYNKEQLYFGNFYSTRQQIGKVLLCKQPTIEIEKIHRRYSYLDNLSTYAYLYKDGKLIEKHAFMYSFKGLLKICEVSERPIAPAVSDRLHEFAMDFCHIGECALKNKIENLSQEAAELRKTIKALQDINTMYHGSMFPFSWFSCWQ